MLVCEVKEFAKRIFSFLQAKSFEKKRNLMKNCSERK
jgi:hypothetical protein